MAGTNSSLFVVSSDLIVDESYFRSNYEEQMEGEQVTAYGHEDFSDLEDLQVLKVGGKDRMRRPIVRIVGKFLPATVIDRERLKVYITNKLTQEVKDGAFSVVYFHTKVDRGENSPGMMHLRRIYEDLPQKMRQQLAAIYVVHPGLKSRFFLATVGRFFLSEGFYEKLVYISRVEFLADYMKKGQVQVPEFVMEHDKELEHRPLMDYGMESADPSRLWLDGHGMTSNSRMMCSQVFY